MGWLTLADHACLDHMTRERSGRWDGATETLCGECGAIYDVTPEPPVAKGILDEVLRRVGGVCAGCRCTRKLGAADAFAVGQAYDRLAVNPAYYEVLCAPCFDHVKELRGMALHGRNFAAQLNLRRTVVLRSAMGGAALHLSGRNRIW